MTRHNTAVAHRGGGPIPPPARADKNFNEQAYITLKAVDLRQLKIYNDNSVLLQEQCSSTQGRINAQVKEAMA